MKTYIAPATNEPATRQMCLDIAKEVSGAYFIQPDIVIFRDNEMQYNFKDSVRAGRVILLGALNNLINEKLMHLGISAARNAGAKEIIPLITYLGYSRQDIADTNRSSLGAKATIKAIEIQHPTSVINLDLHTPHIIGYWDVPVDHIDSFYIFKNKLEHYVNSILKSRTIKSLIFLSPDHGGIKRALWYAHEVERLKMFPGIEILQRHCNKWRNKPNEVSRMELVGDVEGADVIGVDDICDTGGTIIKASNIVIDAGALTFASMITHPVMTTGAELEKVISTDGYINKFFISNSIPSYVPKYSHNFEIVDIGKTLIRVISAIINEESISLSLL